MRGCDVYLDMALTAPFPTISFAGSGGIGGIPAAATSSSSQVTRSVRPWAACSPTALARAKQHASLDVGFRMTVWPPAAVTGLSVAQPARDSRSDDKLSSWQLRHSQLMLAFVGERRGLPAVRSCAADISRPDDEAGLHLGFLSSSSSSKSRSSSSSSLRRSSLGRVNTSSKSSNRSTTTVISAKTDSALGPLRTATPSAFTLSDEALQARGLAIRTDQEGIPLPQLNTLFGKVGFPRRAEPRLALALANTPHLVWLERVDKAQVVGFARATGDGVFNAIIWDVVVDPSLQGQGLGRALMERIMDQILSAGICNICLYAEPQVVSFYKSLGFFADPGEITGMAYRKRRR